MTSTPRSRRSRRAGRCSYQQFADKVASCKRGEHEEHESEDREEDDAGHPGSLRRGAATTSGRRRRAGNRHAHRSAACRSASRYSDPVTSTRGPSLACLLHCGTGSSTATTARNVSARPVGELARRHRSRVRRLRRHERAGDARQLVEHRVNVPVPEHGRHDDPVAARHVLEEPRRPPAYAHRPTARSATATNLPGSSPRRRAPQTGGGTPPLSPTARRPDLAPGKEVGPRRITENHDGSRPRHGELLASDRLTCVPEHVGARARRSSGARRVPRGRSSHRACRQGPSMTATSTCPRRRTPRAPPRSGFELRGPRASAAARTRRSPFEALRIGVEPLLPARHVRGRTRRRAAPPPGAAPRSFASLSISRSSPRRGSREMPVPDYRARPAARTCARGRTLQARGQRRDPLGVSDLIAGNVDGGTPRPYRVRVVGCAECGQ